MRQTTLKEKAPAMTDLPKLAIAQTPSRPAGKLHLLERHLVGAEGALKYAKQQANLMKRVRQEAKLAMKIARRAAKSARRDFTSVSQQGSHGPGQVSSLTNGAWHQKSGSSNGHTGPL